MPDSVNKSTVKSELENKINDLLKIAQKISAPPRRHPPPKHYEFKEYKSQGKNAHKGPGHYEFKEYKSKKATITKRETKKINLKASSIKESKFIDSKSAKKLEAYNQLTRKVDPFMTYRYKVEIAGKNVGGFSEISGIEIKSEMGEHYEGGQNIIPYHYIKKIKYSNITLKRGLTEGNDLWNWYQNIIIGKIEKSDVTIILSHTINKKEILQTWVLLNAFPVKWAGTSLNAVKGDIFIESLELAHSGIIMG